VTLLRRQFLQLGAAGAVASAVPRRASALDYPTRPVHIIVAFPAGNASDIIARLVAQSLSERLGQQFVVENRAGAGGNIGTEVVVRAPPDGYTLLMSVVTSNAINTTFYASLGFNFVRDTAPVASIGGGPYVVVVNPSVPAATLPEFIAYAKANPGKINMASTGIGTPTHVFGALFMMMAGVELVPVPYRGSFMTDLLGGQVQVLFGPVSQSLEHVRTGKLRALAVTTATRQAVLPDVPTVGEFVPGYEASVWYGMVAPRSTPVDVIATLNREINAALAAPAMKARFADLGSTVLAGSPADLGKLMADETEKWAKVIRAAHIKTE